MKTQFKSLSFLALLFSIGFILLIRMNNVSEKEISWDVLGYYLPLPATFIYDDPLMQDRAWIEEVNNEKQLTETLYQVSTNDEGEPIYFFLLGMALLYLPFFLAGHGIAYLFDYPPDGFSAPYQYAMIIGALFYTLIGLIYLRKILLHYFPDKLSGALILIVVFATNYSHHLSLKNLETVNVLFMFVTIIVWNTIQWHTTHKLKNLIIIGGSITLMSMVKPSEIMIVFIPLLWGIYSWSSLKDKIKMIVGYRVQFVLAILVCLLIALPQMSYWLVRTGHLFYDSYKNPGVGLDVFSPYIIESLFSYKKGWLVYTPVMVLSIIGFFYLYNKRREEKFAFFTYALISFYIIVSWTEWWYGAGFSNRPLITVYPILMIAMGFLLMKMREKSKLIQYATGIFIVLCMMLNQFQWWQLRQGILNPYQTTKEYYWATFLATEITEEDKTKLTVYRDFKETHEFTNQEDYELAKVEVMDFNMKLNWIKVLSEDTTQHFVFNSKKEYSKTYQKPFNSLTEKDHVWIKVQVDIRLPHLDNEENPYLVISMERKEGGYGYYAKQIKTKVNSNEWGTFSLDYLTPNLRSIEDDLKVFVWNKEKANFDMDNLRIEIFEKKD